MKAAVNPLKENAKRNYELIKEQNAKITALENKLGASQKTADVVKLELLAKIELIQQEHAEEKTALEAKIAKVHSEIGESKKAIESEQLQKQNLNTARFMKQDEKTVALQ